MSSKGSKQTAARETIESILIRHHLNNTVLHEISTLLNTGLDRQTLSLCVSLCENGVNPEALAVHSPVFVKLISGGH